MSKTVVIAGTGPLLGEAIACEFASHGCSVGLFARSAEYIEDLAADLRADGTDAVAVPTDVTDVDEVAAGFETVREELGSVDVLVHNAAVRSGGPITHCDPEQFENVWQVRAYGGFLCTREAVPDMREEGGTILFTGTSFALDGAAQMVDWGSAGFATRGLARSLADDLSDDGIQVTYAAIHAQVATEGDKRGSTAVHASDVASTFWDLADNDTAITTELDIRPRGSS
jgi:NAD(P)-dependent dehydrogenase (short-subunit alcohol dehydrogenase family)